VHPIGDVWQWLGTSGTAMGAGGGRDVYLVGLVAIALVVCSVNIINAVTFIHEQPRVNPLEPVIWETTSAVTFLLSIWIPWVALRLFPPARGISLVMVAGHLAAAITFSIFHVAGFDLLRMAIYWAAGSHYHYGALVPSFLYEFSKDIFGYVLACLAFLVAARLLYKPPAGIESMFTLRDGARIVRVPFADILAVTAAGNYVEFVLRDGRRQLMRSPLSQIETEFTPRGFVRVHRSWLVNRAALTGLRPDGSGDYTVEIGELTVPLSRRFPDALASLKSS